MRSMFLMMGFLAVCASWLTTAHAGENTCGAAVTTLFKSEYLRGFDEPTEREPVIQTDVYATCPSGWGIDYWNSTSLARGINSGADENDFTGFKVGKTQWFTYDVGVAFFDVSFGHNKTWQFKSGDLIQPYAELAAPTEWTWNSQKFTPFVRVELYQGLGGVLAKRELVYYAGTYHSWQILPDIALNSRGFVVKTPNALGAHSGFNFTDEVHLDWNLGPVIIIFPYVKFSAIIQAPRSDYRNTQFAGGAGLKFPF